MPKVNGLEFGRGHFVGALDALGDTIESLVPILPSGDYYPIDTARQDLPPDKLSHLSQAEITAAKSISCASGTPVSDEMIHVYGADVLIKEYGEINFWFHQILRSINGVNEALGERFMTSVERRDDPRRPGTKRLPKPINPALTPTSNNVQIAPMNTAWSHATPRLVLEYAKEGLDELSIPTNASDKIIYRNRLLKALEIAKDIADEPSLGLMPDASDFTVRFAERLAWDWQSDRPLAARTYLPLLSHLLPMDGYNVEQDITMWWNIAHRLREHAPLLWCAYENLAPAEKSEFRILDIRLPEPKMPMLD